MVVEQQIRTALGHFSLCGDGLSIGCDSDAAAASASTGRKRRNTVLRW